MKKVVLLAALCATLAVSGCAIVIGNHINAGGSEGSSLAMAEIKAVQNSTMSVDEQKDAYLAIAKKGNADGMREYEWKALIEAVEKSTLSAEQKNEILKYVITNQKLKSCFEIEKDCKVNCKKK